MESEKSVRFYQKKSREISNRYSQNIKIVDKCEQDYDFAVNPIAGHLDKQLASRIFQSSMNRLKMVIEDKMIHSEYDSFDKMFEALTEKGFKPIQARRLADALMAHGRTINPDIVTNKQEHFVGNKTVSGYLFSNEAEAEFAGAIKKLSPDTPDKKIVSVMSLTLKLLDIKSEWTWEGI